MISRPGLVLAVMVVLVAMPACKRKSIQAEAEPGLMNRAEAEHNTTTAPQGTAPEDEESRRARYQAALQRGGAKASSSAGSAARARCPVHPRWPG